jgi:hypothetical protein
MIATSYVGIHAKIPFLLQRQQPRATRICALRSETTTRNLPCKVVEAFYRVQDPALFNQTYSTALVVSSSVWSA